MLVDESTLPLVCHLNLAAGFRGGERQTELLIDQLAAMGFRQRLVARKDSALARRCDAVPQLDIRTVSPNPIAAALAARGADVLHAHEARTVHACWLLHAFTRVPYIVTRRVDNAFSWSLLRDIAYRAAAHVVAVSGAVAELIDARYGAGRAVVIPDAHANLALGHTLPRSMRRRYAGKVVIGHVGALDHSHKGQETLIEAARIAREAHPDWHFVLAGSGPDEAALKQAAAGLDNIEFTGFVDNVADWLAVFDVFVLPSLHEGLGSVLLDAMCFGLPIVATNVGGIPDIIEDGVNGFLVDPEDPEALLSAVARILGDSLLADAMQGANIDKAAGYSAQTMARAYLRLYRTALPAQHT